MRLKNRKSPMPSSRASAISELESIVNVTSPSTSDAARPASASAARVAAADSRSSERPDSLENSVAPMPAIDAAPLNSATVASPRLDARRRRPGELHPSGDVVASGHPAGHVDRRDPLLLRHDDARELQRVAGISRR